MCFFETLLRIKQRRCRVGFSRYFTCFAAALLSVSFLVSAQEIPYGVQNRQKLDAIVKEAKAHLASTADHAGWLKAAGIASHQLALLKVDSASEDAVQYLKRASSMSPADTECWRIWAVPTRCSQGTAV